MSNGSAKKAAEYISRIANMAGRFWSRVTSDGAGCLIWTGAINLDGYGHFYIAEANTIIGAHRASWIINRGPIPNGLHVLHSCDNPRCVNINHLFLGTNADNVADKMSKGRLQNQVGENNPRAKLTEEQVRIIRATKRSTKRLAAQFGVTTTAIADARSGKTWGHIT